MASNPAYGSSNGKYMSVFQTLRYSQVYTSTSHGQGQATRTGHQEFQEEAKTGNKLDQTTSHKKTKDKEGKERKEATKVPDYYKYKQ